MGEYIVRLLTPSDAAGMPELATRVYGADYFHREVFHPEELLEKNRLGRLTSAVAIDGEGRVVAHSALERPEMERFAKVGEAMVLPEHQKNRLLGKMGVLLLGEALKQGLAGLFAEPVTHHVFSQRAVEAYQAAPTGIRLGAWSLDGFKIDGFSQRPTPIVYFKYFQAPAKRVLYVPENHQDLALRIFGLLGREVEFREPRISDTAGEVRSRYDGDQRTGLIAVIRPGRDSARQVLEARRSLIDDRGAEAIFVDVFVDEPGAVQVCAALEDAGFFFSGIQPDTKEDRDLLRLQMQRQPIDMNLVETAGDFARELHRYIASERTRLTK